jgi:hypothetical protein
LSLDLNSLGPAARVLTTPVGLLILVWIGAADVGGLMSRLLSAELNQVALNRGTIASQILTCGLLVAAMRWSQAPLILAIAGMATVYLTRLCFFGLATRSDFRGKAAGACNIGEGSRIWRESSRDILPILLDKGAAYLLSASALVLISSLSFPKEVTGILYLFFDFGAKAVAIVSIPFAGLAIPILSRALRQGHSAVTTTLESAIGLIAVTTFLVAIGSITLGGMAFRLLYHVSWSGDEWMVPLITLTVCVEALTFELAIAMRTAQRKIGSLVLQRTVIGGIGALVFLVATHTADVGSSVTALCLTKGIAIVWLLHTLRPGGKRFAGLLLSLLSLSFLAPRLAAGEIGSLPNPWHVLLCTLGGLFEALSPPGPQDGCAAHQGLGFRAILGWPAKLRENRGLQSLKKLGSLFSQAGEWRERSP